MTPRIVIIGAGFAGYHAAKTLCKLAKGRAEIVVVNPTDYFLYLPLLPEVATGILEPRRVTVSLADTLPEVRLVLGEVDGLDLAKRIVRYADPDDQPGEIGYDRLRSNGPTPRTTRPRGTRSARSWWSEPATPGRRWPRTACSTPTS